MAEPISAREALSHFVNTLEPEKLRVELPMVERFIDWFGAERTMAEMSGEDVRRYYDHEIAGEGAADLTHVEPLRALLAYCSRMAFTDANLVPYLQLGANAGGERGLNAAAELGGEAYHVTLEGLHSLEQKLEALKAQRPLIAEKLRAAMADKDFRENAPLDAARDEQAHLESQIRDIEQRLRHAVIIDRDAKAGRANVGSQVRLLNLDRGNEQVFILVSPSEVDPSKGKISIESPVGHALRDRTAGEEVVVQAPAGQIKFRLLEVVD
jgi:transcription elongation factor GreA